jgi:hypothetical protein
VSGTRIRARHAPRHRTHQPAERQAALRSLLRPPCLLVATLPRRLGAARGLWLCLVTRLVFNSRRFPSPLLREPAPHLDRSR